MVQKVQWAKTKDWEGWLRLWKKNEEGLFSEDRTANADIAIGLLHAGPEVYRFSSYNIPEKRLEEELERVRFYLKVAWMDEHPRNTPERIVGNKAYQVLVHILFWKLVEKMKERWASDLQPEREATAWSEIINFFAHSKRNFSLDEEPYRSKARMFIIRLQSSLKDKSQEPFLFPQKTKEIFSQKREDLARGLVNMEAFNHILKEEIFEAIPVLKEKISHQCWDYRPREIEMKKRFPQGREKWAEELEDFRSEAFRSALTNQEKETIILMELIVRRVASVST